MNMPLVLLNRRRRGGSFSPYSLFSGTAIGTWFDPSDLTTMYQDAAGTTAVTTPGQPAGLRLDKSKGLALGAELVTAGWTDIATTTSSIVGGKLRVVGGTNGTYSNFSLNTKVGGTYLITFNASVVSPGTFYVIPKSAQNGGGSNITTLTGTTNTSYRGVFVATTTSEALFIQVAGTWDFDNISVRELPGNHATQSVLASRPVYGIEPAGGRRNLLTWSEGFDNAAWAKPNVTVTPNATTAPNDELTAERIIPTAASNSKFANGSPNYTAATGQSVTYSCYVKADGYSKLALRESASTGAYTSFDLDSAAVIESGNAGSIVVTNAAITSAGGGWFRIAMTCTNAVGAQNNGFGLWLLPNSYTTGSPAFNWTGDTVSGVFAWGAQLELGSTATAYQRVTTAFDVTEAGVQSCHYVQYDGSDDGMVTNSIDFTATDKMSVFAGVWKRTDFTTESNAQHILETSADASVNNGAFILNASIGYSLGIKFGFQTKASGTNGGADATSTAFSAPIAVVATGLGDISGDTRTLRLNGTQIAQNTSDQGTGNFGNYPLYIGRRNNATLPFNGRDYGIVVVGKATTPAEITSTESWLAGKTGVTLP